jgi:peroxiredoxin
MKKFASFGDTVYGISFYRGEMIVHSGTRINWMSGNAVAKYLNIAKAAPSDTFVYEDKWYFKDGQNYLQYDGNTCVDVIPYIPTTSIGRRPAGGGQIHEDINMMTTARKNSFLADGYDEGGVRKGSKTYYLDAKNIDGTVPKVWVNDKEMTTGWKPDYENGAIIFDTPPLAPQTDGQDNVVVQFWKHVSGYKNNILKCTLLQVFDNRVFFSGNPDYPNVVWHCSLNDPGYCSDLDYYREGMDEAAVKGLVAGNNALWVFREPSSSNTNVFYHTPTIDAEYGKIYPSAHSSITIGCTGKAINFNDDIVFFSNRGMEGISGDVTTEQMAAHRSTLVDRKLISEPDYKNMILAEWEGYLLVFIGNKVYLADSRTAFTNENHIEYEWYYWEMEKNITSARVNNGILYLGTDEGIYTLTDTKGNIESFWTTPKDKFKTPHKLKTTNKRGCVVEATGDISVYAKTEDTDFELIGTYENITDYFVSRIKKKKFKDIQLKFYSKTRFSLETATLECFIGGYIKR